MSVENSAIANFSQKPLTTSRAFCYLMLMSESVVTIKLSGAEYRTLMMELEYHKQALKNDPLARHQTQDGHAVRERHSKFAAIVDKM